MKIIKINYISDECRVVLEEFPNITFVIKLDNITTKQGFTDAILAKIPKADINKEKFNNLKLKSLEGTNI